MRDWGSTSVTVLCDRLTVTPNRAGATAVETTPSLAERTELRRCPALTGSVKSSREGEPFLVHVKKAGPNGLMWVKLKVMRPFKGRSYYTSRKNRWNHVDMRRTHARMVNIPPIKMVMTEGWLMALFYPP